MTSTAAVLKGAVPTSRRLILWLVLVAQFMVVLDGTIVAVALPAINSSLDFGSQLSLQWVINAYTLLFGGHRAAAGPRPPRRAGSEQPGRQMRKRPAAFNLQP